MNLQKLSAKELLQLHSSILDELKQRDVVRTRNNPVGDYAEWLVAKGLGLTLATNSSAGFDATDDKGVKYQIKCRRITPENNSRQLGAIRNLEKRKFDNLAAIIFDEHFNIIEAVLIPHNLIHKYAKFKPHQNAHILHLKGAVLNDSEVMDIREFLIS